MNIVQQYTTAATFFLVSYFSWLLNVYLNINFQAWLFDAIEERRAYISIESEPGFES